MRLLTAMIAMVVLTGCNDLTRPTSTRFTCSTQPRAYISPDGRTLQYEIDHYEQAMPCPKTPIE